jgi:hypothetical protein
MSHQKDSPKSPRTSIPTGETTPLSESRIAPKPGNAVNVSSTNTGIPSTLDTTPVSLYNQLAEAELSIDHDHFDPLYVDAIQPWMMC